MHATRLIGLVAALAFTDAPDAQTRDERFPAPPRKATPSPMPYKAKPESHQPKGSRPATGQPASRPPHRPHVEREYEPWPRPRASTPVRAAPPAAQTQTTRTTAPPERDAALAYCDELRRRMERAMRNESRSADERRAIYQEQLRAGCI
jgi:hypothetical protein